MRLWKRYLEWRSRNIMQIALLSEGFEVLFGGTAMAIRWRDVDRIVAFKRDLMTTDLLYMTFETPELLVEAHEDAAGFEEMSAEMEHRLGISSEWKLSVLFPAFHTNMTTIYERSISGVGAVPT